MTEILSTRLITLLKKKKKARFKLLSRAVIHIITHNNWRDRSDIPKLSYVVHKLLNNDTSTDDKINSGDVNNSNPLSSALIASPFRTVIINVVKKFIDQVTVYPNILEAF